MQARRQSMLSHSVERVIQAAFDRARLFLAACDHAAWQLHDSPRVAWQGPGRSTWLRRRVKRQLERAEALCERTRPRRSLVWSKQVTAASDSRRRRRARRSRSPKESKGPPRQRWRGQGLEEAARRHQRQRPLHRGRRVPTAKVRSSRVISSRSGEAFREVRVARNRPYI